MIELLGLFLSALIASTLFPMGSEVVLIALLEKGHNLYLLWLIATIGNTLGSCINYALGLWASGYVNNKYQDNNTWEKAKKFYRRYGFWSLLLAWLPIIGDPLTLIAGLAKTNFKRFLLLVTVGKGCRYAVLIGLTQLVFN